MSAVSPKRKPLQAAITESSPEELRTYLRDFAKGLTAEISNAAPERSEEVLNTLIAELALSAADQRRLRERRQKQAAGIAAAQAKGVRFGRPASPLPDNFDQLRQAWREGEMTLQEAADACGMGRSAFKTAAARKEQGSECRT